MEDCVEDSVSEENRIVVERIKSAIDDIKHLNGLVDGKETTNHIKQNGDVLGGLDIKESVSIMLETEKYEERNDHIGNGDATSTENESPVVESVNTELNGEAVIDEEDILSSQTNIKSEKEEKVNSEETKCIKNDSTDDSSENTDIEIVSVQKADITDLKEQTPVKLEHEEKTIKKFILNDKIRNSLKGLQDKIKSSPDKKPVDAEQEKTNGKSFESDSDIVELSSTIKNKEETEHKSDSTKDPLKRTNSFETDNSQLDDDDVLLSADSEEAPMEIGSDEDGNEDYLLELSDDSTTNIQTETKCNNVKTNLSIFNDKVQFDEDSNSNSMNTGRINEIVNFLNTDLSNAKSPLTIKQTDDQKKDLDQVTIIDDDTPDKAETVEEKLEKLNSTIAETTQEIKDHCNKHQSRKETCDDSTKDTFKDSSKDANTKEEILPTTEDDEEDDDDVIICESETRPESANSVPNTNLETTSSDKTESQQKDNENKEVCMEEQDDDDDDDVIFEKEVKASAGTDDKKRICDTKQDCFEPERSKETGEPSESKTTCTSTKEENNDTPTENSINLTEKSSVDDSDSNSQSVDRKRRAESDSSVCEGESKRSRLDLSGLIGKLGSRVQPTSIEVTDSDEEEEEEEEADTGSLETETADSDEAEVKKDKSEKDNQKCLRITEKELEALVREKVKSYLTTQRDTLIVQLSQKVKELQVNNDLWKRQVKDLQSKVNDVTVLQQKLEERKAKTDALRQITKRSVGLQVDDGRTSSGANSVLREKLASKIMSPTTAAKSTSTNQQRTGSSNKKQQIVPELTKPPVLHTSGPVVTAPPGANGTIRLPIQTSQPLLTQQISQAQVAVGYRPPSVKSLLDTTRVQPTVSSAPGTIQTTTPTSVISLVQLPTRLISQNASTQGYITVPQGSISQAVTKLVTKPSTGSVTTIDLTDDDDASKTRVVTLPPGLSPINPQMPGMRTVLPPGAQIIRSAMPNSQTQYQLVFNSSSPALRPTGVMTGISSIPQTGTILPQNNVVTLSSPTALAPGTSLTRVSTPVVQIPGPIVQPVKPKQPPAAHPAPFPALPSNQATINLRLLPPKPSLKISRVSQGIVLSWNMSVESQTEISNYQLFAYQESSAPPSTNLWKKVGDVKALPLPMACTLTQFQVGNKYHFAVRAMDVNNHVGQFSDPSSIHLTAIPTTTGK